MLIHQVWLSTMYLVFFPPHLGCRAARTGIQNAQKSGYFTTASHRCLVGGPCVAHEAVGGFY